MLDRRQRAALRSKVSRYLDAAERQEHTLWDKLWPLQYQVRIQVDKFQKGRDSLGLPVLTLLPTAKDIKENTKRRKAYAAVHRVSERWAVMLSDLRTVHSKLAKYTAGVLKNGAPLCYTAIYATIARYEKLRDKETK